MKPTTPENYRALRSSVEGRKTGTTTTSNSIHKSPVNCTNNSSSISTSTNTSAIQTQVNTISQQEPTMAAQFNIPLKNFHGHLSENVREWLQSFETYCFIQGITGTDKETYYLLYHLKNSASNWSSRLHADIKEDINKLKQALLDEYDQKDYYNAYVAPQTSSETTEQYLERAEELFNYGMEEKSVIRDALLGMNQEMVKYVKVQQPKTWSQLKAAVRVIERGPGSTTKSLAAISTDSHQTDATINLCNTVAKMCEEVTKQLALNRVKDNNRSEGQRQRNFQRKEFHSNGTQQPMTSNHYGQMMPQNMFYPPNRSQSQFQGSSYIWFLRLLTILLLVQPIYSSEVIHRINYGVVFKPATPAETVTFGVENWIHTFEFTLPEAPTMSQNVKCKDEAACAYIQRTLTEINRIKLSTLSNLNSTNEHIKKLIPELNNKKKSRSRRAILGFIGQISKTLFGTATQDEVEVLAKHIDALTKQNNKITKELSQHANHFSSFISTVNKRLDNAVNGIRQNHDAILFAMKNMKKTYQNFEEGFISISNILTDQLLQASIIESHLDDIKFGINSLIQNKFSPLIIAPQQMQSTLNKVQNILNNKFPNFHILQTDIQFYYAHANFFVSRKDNHIFVSLSIPIASSVNHLKLYEIVTLPVPLNSTSNHGTKLIEHPDYFAISLDYQHYVTFNFNIIRSCFGKDHIYCPNKLAVKASAVPSCEIGLYSDNKDIIKEYCNFRYIPNNVFHEIIELSPSSVIVYNTPILTLNCLKFQKMVHGCKFCIMKLPCQCSLATQHLFLSENLDSCANNSSKITKLHPINLALLQHFFSDEELENIAGDTTFETPVNITDIPQFRIYEHRMSSIVANDKKEHLSLKRMAQTAKQDGVIFRSISDSVMDSQYDWKTSFMDTKSILLISSLAFSITSLFAFIFLFFKFRTLTASMLLFKKAHAVAAPSLHYNKHILKLTNETSNNDAIFDHFGLVTLVLCVFLIALFIYKFFFSRRAETKLLLEVTSGTQCITVPIMTLPLCPKFYNFTPPKFIGDLHAEFSGKLYLLANWPNFKITNLLNSVVQEIPHKIPLSIFQYFKLRSILTTSYSAYILVIHQNYIYSLDSNINNYV